MIGYDSFRIYKSFIQKDRMDIVKYNFKTKVSEKSFSSSPLKYQFINLEENHSRNFIICYFWYVSTYYKGMLYKQPITKNILEKYKAYRKNLVASCLKELDSHNLSELSSLGMMWPKILEAHASKDISLETVCFHELYVKKCVDSFEASEYDYVFQSKKKEIAFAKTFIGMMCNDMRAGINS